ncbi:hypothetical protein ACWEKM_41480 [Streptomyces sp. NPDC004752]
MGIAALAAPVVPWFLFLSHRILGAVAAGVFAAVFLAWAWQFEGARTGIVITALSALIRIIVEVAGVFEPGRAKYAEGKK